MMNRKWIWTLVLSLCLVLLCVSAAVAEDDLKVSMALSSNEFTEPKEITVSISVTNVGEGDMPGPVTLYYPSGKQVEEFGSPTLTLGSSKSWTGTWKVTQAELDAGRITFKIKYSIYNDEGELVNKTKNFSKKIIYKGGAPELTVNRTIKPTTAQQNQEVTVTYDIENTGSVEVTNVTIKENSAVSSKSGTIDSIAAGEKASYTFTTTMKKKDITSAATITYKAGGKSYSQKVEAAVIQYGEVKLSATLSADKKGGAPGETVKLTIKLKNSGTVDFNNVTLTDENLGEIASNLTVKAGETVTVDKEVTVTETQDVQVSVTAEDATGEPVETATGRISIIATDPTQQIVLSVEASADREVVYTIPGNVRFTITVNNESTVDVSDVTVRAVDTVINTFETIPAGASRTFTREMAVSMAGTYQFTASCQDVLSQTLTFSSNSIYVGYEQPTAEPTEAPIVTPPAPQYEEVPETYDDLTDDQKLPAWTDNLEEAAGTAKWIFTGIAALCAVLLGIGFVRRAIRKSKSGKAVDQLEGANYRDYSAKVKAKDRSEISSGPETAAEGETEEPAEQTEDTAQDSELMSETLKRLYNQDASGEGGSGSPEETPEEPAAEETPAEDAAKEDVPGAAELAQRRRSVK